MIRDKQHTERIEIAKREHWEAWLAEPLVRLTLARIPKMEDDDLVRELLHAAFDEGFAAGQTALSMEMINSFIERKERKS